MSGWNSVVPAIIGFAGLLSCTGSGAASSELATDDEAVAVEESAAAPLPSARSASRQSRFSYSGELTQGGFIRGQVPDGTIEASLNDQPIAFTDNGSFFAAFDRDSAAEVSLSAKLADGTMRRETVIVRPRDWRIQRINLPRRSGGASEAWWRKRKPEIDAINAAREQATGAKGWAQDFIWPVKARISGQFGRQRIYRGEPGSYHSGIDLAPGNGVPFVAPADGTVVLARTGFSLEGGLIIIDHGQGLNSAFLHASRIVVEEGQNVRQGQHIGNVGSTGRSTGPHLHWSLKWNGHRFDPLLLAGPMN